jgi:hypothetical protein
VPEFRPHRLWRGADLQTVRHFVSQPHYDLSPWPGRRIWLPVSGGDYLAASLHAEDRAGARPLVVLIHGLTGCEDSHYLRACARSFLLDGYPVCRLNLRGSVPSRPRCAGHYHAGRSDDLAEALAALASAGAVTAQAGAVTVGFSLGGNMMIKMLAESGRELPVRAGVSVSAPIDLAATSRRFHVRRNAIYHHWLLKRLKAESVAPPASLSSRERGAIQAARRVYDFDDGFIAPRHGFTDADDYYTRCSGLRFLPDVRVPLLAIHAQDDPWIPAKAYFDVPWKQNENLCCLLPEKGGHVGFHVRDSEFAWHNRVMSGFVVASV